MVASRCASGIDAAPKSVVLWKRVDVGGGRIIKKKNAARASIMRARFSSSDIGKSPSTCRPGQARDARRSPIDHRRADAVGQHVAGDLILTGEPDIPFALGPCGRPGGSVWSVKFGAIASFSRASSPVFQKS